MSSSIENGKKSENGGLQAAPEVPPVMPVINTLDVNAPLGWLRNGWKDMVNTRFRGVFYGLIFVLMGFAIAWIYATRWQLTMGLIGGFFLMGPFLCTGIYDLSRQYERGERISLLASSRCWVRNAGAIGFFAIMLTFAMIVWARVSVILFALASSTSFPTLKGVIAMIFSIDNLGFLFIWSGVGLLFATLVFSIGVIAVPLMLDRGTDVMMAVFSSVRSVYRNPRTLFFWALLIVLIIGLSLVAGFVPLLLTAPLIGHATWHAYRELVATTPVSTEAVS